MKSLSSPVITQAAAEQSGWGELYDIYLKDYSVLRLCTVPGGVIFFRPKTYPEDVGTRGAAQAYTFWPLKRDTLKAGSDDQNDRLTFAASNVTTEYAQMLADVDWADTPVMIRKISLSIAAPTADDCVTLFSGLVDSARVTNEQIQFTCSNFLGSLTTKAPRENMHNNCRFRWADDFCTAIRFRTENYAAKTAGAASTTTLLKSAGLTEDAGSNGSYGTDLVNALADAAITASSEFPEWTNQAVGFNSVTNLISLTAHQFHSGQAFTLAGSVPGGLYAGVTYYAKPQGSNNFLAMLLFDGSVVDLTTSGNCTLSTPGAGHAHRVKSSQIGPWNIYGAADLGTLTQAYWTIPTVQGGLANAALKPYIQFDFGSAKTPRVWRISTINNANDLAGLPRVILFFSSSDAATWAHESYAELPPRGGVLFDVLIPKAATKRYWRICIRSRWGQSKAYTMLNKVYAYEGGRNWWAQGTVTFDAGTTTVALRGKSYAVRESYSGETVVERMPVAAANGDTFVIERGCGRSFNHCCERLNWENFGGFLDLPFQAIIRA